MSLDQSYLDSRAKLDYSSHDELQMHIIVCKIRDELVCRYGVRVDLIKDDVLRKLVGEQGK